MSDLPHKREMPRPDLAKLLRRVIENLGVSPSDPICRDIKHLSKAWNPILYESVQRRVRRLEDVRECGIHFADRVPPPEIFDGALSLAAAPTPSGKPTVVRVDLFQLVLHMIVVGLPGRGKTYFCRLLVSLLVRLFPTVNILIFDPNRSYEACCSNPRVWLSIPWHEVRLNPIVEPRGYPDATWRVELIDRLARDELLHSKYLLARCLDDVVAEARREAAAGGEYCPPSLFDLRDYLANLKFRFNSREAGYRESSLNVLDGRLRTSGRIYDCARGMEEALTATRLRIDTQGLAPIESLQFFIESVLHYAYRRRCLEPLAANPSLHTLVLVEESQTLLDRRPGRPIAFYEEMLLRSRSLGLGFLFIAQDMSRIDESVRAAVSNYVVFGQSTAENKRMIQNLLDLSRREADMLGELDVGECFLRLAHHSWPHSFIARIPNV